MLRFISFLLGKPYETCKSCEILKQQLAIVNEEKKELTSTLLGLIKPKAYESPATELQSLQPPLALWSKRKAALEAADKESVRLAKSSPLVARPDAIINKLEQELGINNEADESSEVAGGKQ